MLLSDIDYRGGIVFLHISSSLVNKKLAYQASLDYSREARRVLGMQLKTTVIFHLYRHQQTVECTMTAGLTQYNGNNKVLFQWGKATSHVIISITVIMWIFGRKYNELTEPLTKHRYKYPSGKQYVHASWVGRVQTRRITPTSESVIELHMKIKCVV